MSDSTQDSASISPSFPCPTRTLEKFTALFLSYMDQDRATGLSSWQVLESQLKTVRDDALQLSSESSFASPHVQVKLLQRPIDTVTGVQAELNALRAQKEELKRDRDEARSAESAMKLEVESLQAKLALYDVQMKDENARFEREIASFKGMERSRHLEAQDSFSRRLEEASAVCEAKVKEVSAALERSNLRAEELEGSKRESETVIFNLLTSFSNADTALAESKKHVEQCERELGELREAVLKAENEHQTAVVALEEQRLRAEEAENQLASVHAEARTTEDEHILSSRGLVLSLAFSQQQVADLRRKLSTAHKEAKATEENYWKRISSMGASTRKLKDERAITENEVGDLRAQLLAAHDEKEAEKRSHEKRMDGLLRLVAAVEKTANNAREKHKKEVDDLRHQAQREADLAKARNEKQDSDLRLQMEKAKEEREKNEKKVTDLCLHAEENARDVRDTHEKEINHLRAQAQQEGNKVQESHRIVLSSLNASLHHHGLAFLAPVPNSSSYVLKPSRGLVNFWQKIRNRVPSLILLPGELEPDTPPVMPAICRFIIALLSHIPVLNQRLRNLRQCLCQKDEQIAYLHALLGSPTVGNPPGNAMNSKIQTIPIAPNLFNQERELNSTVSQFSSFPFETPTAATQELSTASTPSMKEVRAPAHASSSSAPTSSPVSSPALGTKRCLGAEEGPLGNAKRPGTS